MTISRDVIQRLISLAFESLLCSYAVVLLHLWQAVVWEPPIDYG